MQCSSVNHPYNYITHVFVMHVICCVWCYILCLMLYVVFDVICCVWCYMLCLTFNFMDTFDKLWASASLINYGHPTIRLVWVYQLKQGPFKGIVPVVDPYCTQFVPVVYPYCTQFVPVPYPRLSRFHSQRGACKGMIEDQISNRIACKESNIKSYSLQRHDRRRRFNTYYHLW